MKGSKAECPVSGKETRLGRDLQAFTMWCVSNHMPKWGSRWRREFRGRRELHQEVGLELDFEGWVGYFFFNCSIFALQCCVSFCCTIMWISYMYTYILSLWASLPPHPHPTHLDHPKHRAELSFLCFIAGSHQLSILHMTEYICQCYTLHLSQPLFPHCVCKSVLYVCISTPALQIG